MGKTTGEIATDIDHTREHLRSNLQELEDRVKAATDWRGYVGNHLGTMTVAALIGGMLLSSMVGKRRPSHEG